MDKERTEETAQNGHLDGVSKPSFNEWMEYNGYKKKQSWVYWNELPLSEKDIYVKKKHYNFIMNIEKEKTKCVRCGSTETSPNGVFSIGKPLYDCYGCGRYFCKLD